MDTQKFAQIVSTLNTFEAEVKSILGADFSYDLGLKFEAARNALNSIVITGGSVGLVVRAAFCLGAIGHHMNIQAGDDDTIRRRPNVEQRRWYREWREIAREIATSIEKALA